MKESKTKRRLLDAGPYAADETYYRARHIGLKRLWDEGRSENTSSRGDRWLKESQLWKAVFLESRKSFYKDFSVTGIIEKTVSWYNQPKNKIGPIPKKVEVSGDLFRVPDKTAKNGYRYGFWADIKCPEDDHRRSPDNGKIEASVETQEPSTYDEIIEAEGALRNLAPTERKAVIDARLGQGRFRENLLALWENKCAVTQCSLPRCAACISHQALECLRQLRTSRSLQRSAAQSKFGCRIRQGIHLV